MKKYQSTKTYGHNLGFSCAFRQWRATHSHCSFLHGYAIAVKLVFESDSLDDKNWVMDFGGLKDIKRYLEDMFDHKTLVAKDDPELAWFKEANKKNLIDLRIVDATGCEKFAEMICEYVHQWLTTNNPRVAVVSCEVMEHPGNSALYIKVDPS